MTLLTTILTQIFRQRALFLHAYCLYNFFSKAVESFSCLIISYVWKICDWKCKISLLFMPCTCTCMISNNFCKKWITNSKNNNTKCSLPHSQNTTILECNFIFMAQWFFPPFFFTLCNLFKTILQYYYYYTLTYLLMHINIVVM